MKQLSKFTAEQLSDEQEARAAREELFRRICAEAEATACTFDQAAARLRISRSVVEYFEADRQSAKTAWEKIRNSEPDQAVENENPRGPSQSGNSPFTALLQRHFRIVVGILGTVALLVLLGNFFRYDVRSLDPDGYVILRHDRWTGNVERCTNIRHPLKSLVGCSSYIYESDESSFTKAINALMFWDKKEEPAQPPPPPTPAVN